MKRVVKDPEIRKNEIIGVAEKLFFETGYEETSISDIVKKAKVAHGTFYYYFKTKEKVLDAIIERIQDELFDYLEKISNREDLNAVEKFIEFLKIKMESFSSGEKLWEYLFKEKNSLLFVKFQKNSIPKASKHVEKIIKQGVKEGYFNTPYPKIAAYAMLHVNLSIATDHDFFEKNKIERSKIIFITFDLIERIFGAKTGIFIEYLKKQNVEVDF